MSGRARTRARGRARGRASPQPAAPGASAAPGAAAPGASAAPGGATTTRQPGQILPRPQPLPAESQVVEPRQPRGAEGTSQPSAELQLSAGLQAASLRGNRGFSGVFRDLVVNTRQNLEHVRKSKTGSKGTAVRLFANHFRVTSRPQWVTYQYNVDYKPDIEDGSLRADLLKQHESLLGKCRIFDGNSLLLPRVLRKRKTEVVSKYKEQPVKITIEFSRELMPTSPDCLRYYNILFRKILKSMELKQIGRNYYNKCGATQFLDHSLEVWPGYFTSILEYENSITLCADVSHKLLRMETAYDVIMRIVDTPREGDVKQRVSKALVGLIVLTKHNNRTYRVDAINWEETPKATFKKSDGNRITFVDYYRQQYDTQVTDLTQPLLISKGKWKKSQQDTPNEPVLLVPELCSLTGLTDAMRQDYRVMRDLALHMRLDPDKRQHELQKFMNTVQRDKTAQEELRLWDLKFDTNFLSFSGRLLKEVRICQGRRVFNSHPLFAEWSKETRKGPLLKVKSLDDWLMLYTKRNYGAAVSLMQCLRKVTPTMGIAMRDAKMLEVNDTVKSYINVLEKHASSKTQMVVCVLSSDRKEMYDGIKKFLCVNYPIPSQCVVARTLDKPQTLMTIATKIAQQMNCKMGGALWKVETGLRNTMFIGIDCFHDIVNRRKSIAGFVSSVNDELTQWFSQCIFQESGQELVNGLRDCLQAALKLWREHNPFMPRSVIVYRDGVGDGQLEALIKYEIPQISSCLESILQTNDVKLAVIVVKKRINTRFFVESEGKLRNPRPGTVVDVELTRKEWYDFFIVSQSVKDGTVTPTHYNVIHDTVRLSPDTVQGLTYRLCHMYYNLPGVIRVPAPCHYAHKLAYLVGQSIHQEPHHSLTNRLFYL
ncbi:piwi-like protein 3 [Equus przewalskii]|uniref:Piwi like RNA-mediated silencing 3 n=2 Tax=Equus TaxID=9789 RepID=F6ZFD5_HORSE|nr:piwi-like protein 3 [Equus caballus]XP_023502723.1 piwi-like protein 3 [Equus caballus]